MPRVALLVSGYPYNLVEPSRYSIAALLLRLYILIVGLAFCSKRAHWTSHGSAATNTPSPCSYSCSTIFYSFVATLPHCRHSTPRCWALHRPLRYLISIWYRLRHYFFSFYSQWAIASGKVSNTLYSCSLSAANHYYRYTSRSPRWQC